MFYQIAAMMIWSSAFIAAKFAETMLDPILLVQFRLLIVAVILLPIGIPMFRKLPKNAWKPLIWLSFLNYIAVLILQFKGLQYTSASSALTMLGLEPLLVVFIGHFFFDDKARRYHWICGVLAFIGVFTLILGGQHAGKGGEISLLGCAMVLSGVLPSCAPRKNLCAKSPPALIPRCRLSSLRRCACRLPPCSPKAGTSHGAGKAFWAWRI